jgi:predicted P-loop ATPase
MVEESELNTQDKNTAEAWKAFVTRTHERFRPPWGKVEEMRPRQCLIWGSTNQPRYIKDDSGGRRFWGIKCGEINLEALKTDRNQLFAEAVFAFRAGDAWHPDREFEELHVRPRQAERQQTDEWLNVILHYVDNAARPLPWDVTRTRIADIWWYALGQLNKPINRADQFRISSLLHHKLNAPSGHDRKGTWYDLSKALARP